MSNIAIYTACYGEQFNPLPPVQVHECDYCCFTDHLGSDLCPEDPWCRLNWDPALSSIAELPNHSGAKSAKLIKSCPVLFDKYDYSIYVDSTHVPRTCPYCLIRQYLKDTDLALFAHPRRRSLYEEAKTCIDLGKDDRATIQRQVAKYRGQGMPDSFGLWCGTVILRRHTTAMEEFGVHWWNEIEEHSIRDQISLPYVLWKHKIPVTTIPGNVYVNKDFQVPQAIRQREQAMWNILKGTEACH